jgi:1,4-dihydroxy-2-naphthoate octaprenyltransferase
MMIQKLQIWIDAARPKTLWASVAPVLIGTAMAYSEGQRDPFIGIFTLLSAIFIQVGTNYANDYFDFVKGADTHERIGPVRATEAGLVKPQSMQKAFILSFTLAILFGIPLIIRGGFPILIIGSLSVMFGILYTGGPFPLWWGLLSANAANKSCSNSGRFVTWSDFDCFTYGQQFARYIYRQNRR